MTGERQSEAGMLEALRRRGIIVTLEGDRLGIRAPKGALTEGDKALLALNRDRLVAYLRGCPAEPTFPLTEIQAAYWFGRQSDVLGGVGCHAYREFRLAGIDVDRLEASWNRVVARHGMLRAVFTPDGSQRVLKDVPHYRFEAEILTGQQDAARRLEDKRAALSHHVFDPTQWPLFDIRLSVIGSDTILHMGIDLLIADAASILLIYQEWRHIYEKPEVDLPWPTRTFAEFVHGSGPSSGQEAEAEAYWRPRLAGLPGPPQLPLRAAPADIGKPQFVRRTVSLPPARWNVVAARARDAGLTPSALLLAVYADILAAYSKTQHFLMTLTTFRAPRAFAGVVGDFTSTLLVEADGRLPHFRDRALGLQASMTAALEHDGWSGVRLARERARLTGDTDAAIPVVFTSALGHRGSGAGETPLAWLGEATHAITQTPQVWIDHHVIETGEGLSLSFDVVRQLFEPAHVDAMVNAYARMLDRLSNPAAEDVWLARLGDHLPERDLAERRAANETTIGRVEGTLLDGVLRVDGQRTALDAADGVVGYAGMLGRAAAIAHLLRQHGVGPGQFVGVAMPKSASQVIAVIGILLAGAAYMPVPVTSPPLRRRNMIAQGKVGVVLTDHGSVGDGWPDSVVVIAADRVDAKRWPSDVTPPQPDDLAYVIFTSGSTGTPKGVLIEHRAALNTIRDINSRFTVTSDDAVLALSDLGFDLSVYDVFGLLGAGGRVVLPRQDRLRDPGHWSDLLRRHRVTVWNSVPALASMLVEHGEGPYPDLRLMLLSGDWVPVDLPDKLRVIAPNARIIALGGATEASIWSNFFDTADVVPGSASVPYGWPLSNQRFHVLNEALEPCPCMVAGGLYIAGDGLARGYLGDAELTARKFFRHPVSGERLYATGDMGRYLPGGAIEFLGREDAQVKVRGHRIELGEIEAALASHPAVRAASVFVTPSANPADHRLAACVVTSPPRTADYQLQHHAKQGTPAITDPVERLQFRLKRVAQRPLQAGARRVALTDSGTADAPRRRSVRRFKPSPVGLSNIAALLKSVAASDGPDGPKYRYPSAGSAYPIQVWVHARRDGCDGIEGLYAYHPERHDLEEIEPGLPYPVAAHAPGNRAIAEGSRFAIYLVAALDAIEPLYGALARDFALIEAGAMCQLLMEEAAERGLGLCMAGGLDTAALSRALELGDQRFVAMTLLGGLPDESEQAGPGQSLAEELRRHVATHVPSYMVPDRIITVTQLPLTANGKVDKTAMAAMAGAAAPPAVIEAAGGVIEERVTEILSTVLGRQGIGRNDAVFDLGGTSVHIVRIHRQLAAHFNTAVDIVDIFRAPTVAGIARLLATAAPDRRAADLGSDRGERRRVNLRTTARGGERA